MTAMTRCTLVRVEPEDAHPGSPCWDLCHARTGRQHVIVHLYK